MADFATWGRACEPAFAAEGAFLRAYDGNREGLVESTLEGDAVAAFARKLAEQPGGWEGTATAFLAQMQPAPGESRGPALPRSPKSLADKLRRAATFLRAVGVQMKLSKEGKARTRMIRLWMEAPV